MLKILMKKIIFLIAFPVLYIGLTQDVFPQTIKYVIGYPEDDMSNEWRAAQVREVEKELNNHNNVKLLTSDAKGSIERNIIDIEYMVSQQVQLLFLAPRNPDVLEPIVEKLYKSGIKIILLTRKMNSEHFDTFIGPNDFEIAYNAATYLAEQMHEEGVVLMLEGIKSTTTAIQRGNGFLKGISKYKKIKTIIKTANYSKINAIMVVEDLYTQQIRYDAIFAHNDAMAIGAHMAQKNLGIDPATVPAVSIDYLPEIREAIRKGEHSASFTYPTCGKEGVKAALALLQGKKVPRFIPIPSQIVTKENVEKVPTTY